MCNNVLTFSPCKIILCYFLSEANWFFCFSDKSRKLVYNRARSWWGISFGFQAKPRWEEVFHFPFCWDNYPCLFSGAIALFWELIIPCGTLPLNTLPSTPEEGICVRRICKHLISQLKISTSHVFDFILEVKFMWGFVVY
jgi:hypothetical protein